LMVLLTAFGVLPGILVYAAAALIMPDAYWAGGRDASDWEEPLHDSERSDGAAGGGQGEPHSDAEFDSFFKKERDGHGSQR
ncbi:MAG: PspC domain-containing protein, partial [Treponemataceae bacterium]|nr:PspC domain-containing protein [Treponemataceae bacterium]